MSNRTLKGLKSIVNFALLGLTFTIGCLPLAFPGSDTLASKKSTLCNLILKVNGGTAALVNRCNAQTTLSDEDRIRLCDASNKLTDADKNILRQGLIDLGIDPDKQCPILNPITPDSIPPTKPATTPPTIPATKPATTPPTTPATKPATTPPTTPATNPVTTPPTTPATTTNGGGTVVNNGEGGSNSNLPLNVIIHTATPSPAGITASAGPSND